MNAYAEYWRTQALKRGQTSERTVEPDPDWSLPQPAMPRLAEADGCYSCYRTQATLNKLGHVDSCRFANR